MLRGGGLDAVVVGSAENVRYVTEFQTDYGTLFARLQFAIFVVDTQATTLLTVDYYVDWAKRQCPWLDGIVTAPWTADKFVQIVKEALKQSRAKGARIGFDSALSPAFATRLANEVGADAVRDADSVLLRARAIKTPLEISIVRAARTVAEAGMEAALASIKPGARELEVAAKAEYAMRLQGADGYPFHAVVISGPHASAVEEVSTSKAIRRGETVLVDQGCVYRGYVSEFARTLIVGRPTKEQRQAYTVVYQALESGRKQVRAGAKAYLIDSAARAVVGQSGFGAYAHPHMTGHGQGLAGWELPMIHGASPDRLEAGMVVAVEPGVFKASLGGIRLEDVYLVTDSGAETLTRTKFMDELLT